MTDDLSINKYLRTESVSDTGKVLLSQDWPSDMPVDDDMIRESHLDKYDDMSSWDVYLSDGSDPAYRAQDEGSAQAYAEMLTEHGIDEAAITIKPPPVLAKIVKYEITETTLIDVSQVGNLTMEDS